MRRTARLVRRRTGAAPRRRSSTPPETVERSRHRQRRPGVTRGRSVESLSGTGMRVGLAVTLDVSTGLPSKMFDAVAGAGEPQELGAGGRDAVGGVRSRSGQPRSRFGRHAGRFRRDAGIRTRDRAAAANILRARGRRRDARGGCTCPWTSFGEPVCSVREILDRRLDERYEARDRDAFAVRRFANARRTGFGCWRRAAPRTWVCTPSAGEDHRALLRR